jgi:hypothetical protein
MFIFVGMIIPVVKILLKLIYNSLSKESGTRQWIEYFLPENLKDLPTEPSKVKKALFAKVRVTSQINSYLAIMISFGGLFPPLAVIAAIAVITISYYEELNFGRLLLEARSLGKCCLWVSSRVFFIIVMSLLSPFIPLSPLLVYRYLALLSFPCFK